MPILAHPGSAQGQCILAPSSPQAEPALSQCPGSRVPQLLLGFSVEPRWGLMGDCQAPLNRILIIQLQQEFFPPGLGPSQIPPSLPQHLPSPSSLLSQAPGASPTQRGGLWPISWGPREGLASAPSNHREDSTSSWGEPCCGELPGGLRPEPCVARPDFNSVWTLLIFPG